MASASFAEVEPDPFASPGRQVAALSVVAVVDSVCWCALGSRVPLPVLAVAVGPFTVVAALVAVAAVMACRWTSGCARL